MIVPIDSAHELTYAVEFPITPLNITQNPPANCADHGRGYINVERTSNGVEYLAGDFGVNCAGYVFDYMSSAQSYLLQVTGKNLQGRGIKMFLDYTDSGSHADQFIFPEKSFYKYVSFSRVSDDPRDRYLLNWETRSFGKESATILKSLLIAPYPEKQIAGIKLSSGKPNVVINDLQVSSHRRYLESIHLANYKCGVPNCFLGLDQSWDKLWVAIPLDKPWSVLPHYRLNNWANIWQLSGEGTVAILYLPQLLSTASFLFLTGVTLILVYLVWQNPYSKRYKEIKRKLVLKLQG